MRKSTVELWMDTFCIPIDPNNTTTVTADDEMDMRRKTAKQNAIRLMTPIYAGAENVLVLDSELQSISTHQITFAELTSRIHVAGWASRAWTLQEGSLASLLCFQFENGFLFSREGEKLFDDAMKVAIWNRSYDEEVQLLEDCRQSWFLPAVGRQQANSLHGLSNRELQFMNVWNNLLGKSTTKTEDFYEIIAKYVWTFYKPHCSHVLLLPSFGCP